MKYGSETLLSRRCPAVPPTVLGTLRAWAESYAAYAMTNPHALHLQFFRDYRRVDLDRLGPEVRQRYDEIVGPMVAGMRAVVRAGQDDGSLRQDLDPNHVVGQFAYALRAILNRVLFPGDSFAAFDRDAFVRDFLDIFLRGLAADTDATG